MRSFLTVISILLCYAGSVGFTRETVRWSAIQEEIGKTICIKTYPVEGGKTGYAFLSGIRSNCSEEPAVSPLARAVDRALEGAFVLLAPIGSGSVGFRFDNQVTLEENRSRMVSAYLGSGDFLSPILRRLPSALEAEGLACTDCPAPPEIKPRRLQVAELLPYVAAYFWPDPVRSKTDEQGEPTGESAYSFHICSGFNGINEMKDPDPGLVKAGFVAAFGNEAFRALAKTKFREILNEPKYAEQTDNDARTDYLRRRSQESLLAGEELPRIVCKRLSGYRADLGLELTGCPSTSGE